MGAQIEVDHLTVTYGDLRAVDDVTFGVGAGEFFGLLGPNGAGKTTMLETIEGLRRPDAGSVRIDGYDPYRRDPQLCARIGVQMQSSAFFERLTAREQLATFAALYGVGRDRVDLLLEQVGLVDKADAPVEKLSGGQAQRLSIACALVHDPQVVFLDEPTSALDPQARRNLWDFLLGLHAEGRTVMLTTHSMEEAEQLCDRVAIVDHGRLLALDAPARLVAGLDAPTRIILRPDAISAADAQALPGVDAVQPDEATLTLITRQAPTVLGALGQREALDGLRVRGATLEDVFLDLTGREYRA
ncbi:ABC-2 type transport system ATP-binding protein [Branchiibius hedensis]|uniref:ABC-2 type transport system ATP-binding protein n=1 Tax=Branchiibius hedensis TaxID=672460 RepID=A0A2Y8ZWM8_9MICO|nr:ABC transporter ATP-binding protein [Branchiibius hedensis]PWJ25836.1 ABC-2 type transport system ATP-binding protein [Branchiibius hedensis]SSA34649.1 ABC-2 type transport system ATP-binding protein [Branchiibius hedensis]